MANVFKVGTSFFHSLVGMEVKVHSITLANATSDVISYKDGADLFSVSDDAIAIRKEHKTPYVKPASGIYDVIPSGSILYATVEWDDPNPRKP